MQILAPRFREDLCLDAGEVIEAAEGGLSCRSILCSESRRGTDEDGGIDPGDLSWSRRNVPLSLAWASYRIEKTAVELDRPRDM